MKRCHTQIQIAALVLAMLAASVPAVAQAGATKPQPAAPGNQSSPTPQDRSSGVPHEGIKVHGHWTIVIKNPDGSVASRTDFENALVAGSGSAWLSQLLARQSTVGTWAIKLANSNASQNVCYVVSPTFCLIQEPSEAGTSAYLFPNLIVQVPTSGVNANAIVLTGTAKGEVTGAIDTVSTVLRGCVNSVAPSACPGVDTISGNFTAHSLGTAIAVQAGQSIDVTVVLNFM